MLLTASSDSKEQSPVEVEDQRQCYICDRYFRTKRELLSHRRSNHDEVIVFEICRDERRIFGFSNSWKIPNFDDLFLNSDGNSNLEFAVKKKNIIRKVKRNVKYCRNEGNGKMRRKIGSKRVKLT